MKKFLLLLAIVGLFLPQTQAQTTVKKVVLQGFWWDYYNNNYHERWANYLTELAPRLKSMGVDAVWIPPTSKNMSSGYVGYSPFDHYDLGDKWQKGNTRTRLGTKDELLRMIAVMHANGIEVIQDVVLNHVNSAGSAYGNGGQDFASLSMATESGYKNFRYVSYATPATDEGQTNYWNRSGRWAKNYTNFYPNQYNNCTTGDICSSYFGPDVSYESTAFGQSSNVVGFNPAQSANYMRDGARNWIMWLKKQTAVDGFRWDAVKHFPTSVQEDLSYNVKYILPTWCKGGEAMFNVGEWVGSKNDLDNYVNAIAAPTSEKMMGTFDFGLRAFDNSGGLYGMVYGMGNFNMASLPGAQQDQRVHYYAASNTYVHRTVPFVNNHDTFRPQLSNSGNYTGWNTGSELSGHIEPNEPRLSAAYAVMLAMDGSPQLFFEDLFDIGYNGNRWTHDPKSATSLPARSDLTNLLWCHQVLDFKSGAYQVPYADGDYLIIARAGKAIVGVTDSWSTWQNKTVYTGYPAGTILKDYSGANGTATVTVDANGFAAINTPPVNPVLNAAGRRGYSVWARVGMDALTYAPPRSKRTTQEWEMANDLGDSHVNSLGQGGAIPASSTNFRTAGKIFVQSGKVVTYTLYPENATKSLFVGLYNAAGTLLSSRSGTGTLVRSYTPNFTGWITIRVRNAVSSNPTQRCWVNVSYEAPAVVTNANAATSNNTSAIWTGNGGTSDWHNPYNWEEGKLPDAETDVVIEANAFPQPAIMGMADAANIRLEEGAQLFVHGELTTQSIEGMQSVSGTGIVHQNGETVSLATPALTNFRIYPNPYEERFDLAVSGVFEADQLMKVQLMSADGRLIATLEGTLAVINDQLNLAMESQASGVYLIQVVATDSQVLRLVKQ
jgi:alpha-amylase